MLKKQSGFGTTEVALLHEDKGLSWNCPAINLKIPHFCWTSRFINVFTKACRSTLHQGSFNRHSEVVFLVASQPLHRNISLSHSTHMTNVSKTKDFALSMICKMNTQLLVRNVVKVPYWGTTTPQPPGLLCSHPEGVPSFISRGAAHRTVYSVEVYSVKGI
jgi:hypothetical protein